MAIPVEFLKRLAAARSVTILTGAGVSSAESGVPTFRDAQTGLWAKYRPEDLATPRAFRRNPRLVWKFISIGTSTVVHPAASLPFEALRAGATVVEINPQSTPLTNKAQFVFSGAAGVVLPGLLAGLKASGRA